MQVRLVRADNPGAFTLEGTNTWLVGRDPVLLIDPGPDDAGHLQAVIDTLGTARVRAILLTHHHPDHASGAASVARVVGAPILSFGPGQGERELVDGGLVAAGAVRLVAVATPGHAPDHAVFHDPESGSLFTGDAVLGRGTSVIDPPEGDMGEYLRSLRRMLALAPATLYPGHGPIVEDGRAKLLEYVEHRQRREREVLAALGDGPRAPEDMVTEIYAGYPPQLHPAAARSVLAHLLKLEREGRVRRVSGAAGERFVLVDA